MRIDMRTDMRADMPLGIAPRAIGKLSAGSTSALHRHRRRHVDCAVRGGHFEYRHAHTRTMDMHPGDAEIEPVWRHVPRAIGKLSAEAVTFLSTGTPMPAR